MNLHGLQKATVSALPSAFQEDTSPQSQQPPAPDLHAMKQQKQHNVISCWKAHQLSATDSSRHHPTCMKHGTFVVLQSQSRRLLNAIEIERMQFKNMHCSHQTCMTQTSTYVHDPLQHY
jgi:hypothetical protein